jgi:hypothetical protein
LYVNGHHLYHDLSKTIEELGIDDYPPELTTEEKQATVGDLIKARSGIYHAALGESPGMKAMRPERHSHRPGTFWYYKDKCWLKAKILTGGRKVSLDLVLDGDTIKWYDPEGTLGGKGDYSRIN